MPGSGDREAATGAPSALPSPVDAPRGANNTGSYELTPESSTPENNVFIAPKENFIVFSGARGLYGGQIVAQAAFAAMKTVPDTHALHSLHTYFILSGNPGLDMRYVVTRVRDGKSLYTRSVSAEQDGVIKCFVVCSFHRPEPSFGFNYHDVMAREGWEIDPEGLPTTEALMRERLADETLSDNLRHHLEIELASPRKADVRGLDQKYFELTTPHNGDMQRDVWWLRLKHPDGDQPWKEIAAEDMQGHRVALAYMSDFRLLFTGLRPVGGFSERRRVMMTSLDHSIWFHALDGWRSDHWLFVDARCQYAGGSRATVFGKIWDCKTKRLVASVSQEGLVRFDTEVHPKLLEGSGVVPGAEGAKPAKL